MFQSSKFIAASAAAAALLLVASPAAQAQAFPGRTVTIVVPFAPGGPNDIIARTAAVDVTKTWNQPVVVENRPGAGGVVGATYVSQREPDGHTLLISTNVLTFPILTKGLTIKPREDLVPVTIVAGGPLVLAGSTQLGARTLDEVVAKAKASPGKLNSGVIGSTLSHLDTAYLLKKVLGVDVTMVPYNSTAQSLQALLAGQSDLGFTVVQAIRANVEAGKIVAIAVAASARDPRLPNVPTFKELGKAYETGFWLGFYAPRGTPSALARRIADDFASTFRKDEVRVVVEKSGMSLRMAGPAAMRQIMDTEEKLYLDASKFIEARQ